MLGNLVLFFLQLAAGWAGAPFLLRFVPSSGDLQNFVLAALIAPVIWATGVLGSFVLKDVKMPTPVHLVWALLGALAGAAILASPLRAYLPSMPPLFLPLLLACTAYMLKK
jgi:hypothetical protein